MWNYGDKAWPGGRDIRMEISLETASSCSLFTSREVSQKGAGDGQRGPWISVNLMYLYQLHPQDEDGGDGRIAEEEYDALNDETFGSAINGDWEEAHETMVRLGGNGERVRKRPADASAGGSADVDFPDHGNGGAFRHPNLLSSGPSSSGSTPAPFNAPFRQSRHIGDSDLELNLSSMKLDDMDLSTFTDSEAGGLSNRINLDSAVWASHPFPNNQPLFREPLRSAFKPQQPHHQQQHQIKPPPEANANFPLHHLPPPPSQQAGPKITTLEDIERNMIIQQAMPKQHQQQQQLQQHQQQQQQQPQQHHLHQPGERKMFDDFSLGNRQQVATPTMMHQQQKQPPQQQQAPQQPQHKGKQTEHRIVDFIQWKNYETNYKH